MAKQKTPASPVLKLPKDTEVVDTSVLMDFYQALRVMENGEKVSCISWEGMAKCGYIRTKDGKLVWVDMNDIERAWILTDSDIKANDWYMYKEKNS